MKKNVYFCTQWCYLDHIKYTQFECFAFYDDRINLMKYLYSIKDIEKTYSTGEEPVLVSCNDHNSYICKYARYSGSANKLVCELMGALLAKKWMLNTPEVAMVKVSQAHVPYGMSGSFFSKPILGSLQKQNVVDITPTTIPMITPNEKLCWQLLNIALFDFWLSNEDRNANNANLMYDMANDSIIAIDFGCCFNTATFDYPLSLLTESDSILLSDLFDHISSCTPVESINQMAYRLLNNDMMPYLHDCELVKDVVLWDDNTNAELGCPFIPSAWGIDRVRLKNKMEELLSEEWVEKVRNGLIETLNTALQQ